ncbi:MAG: hypothetical protein Q9188_001378 [Gyalolechia gomerana]
MAHGPCDIMFLFPLQHFTFIICSFLLFSKHIVDAQVCSDVITQLTAGTTNKITLPCVAEELVLTDSLRNGSHLAIPTNCTLNSTMYLGLNRTDTADSLKLTFVCDSNRENKCYTFKVFPAAEDQTLLNDTVACFPSPTSGTGSNARPWAATGTAPIQSSSVPSSSQSAGVESPSYTEQTVSGGSAASSPGLNDAGAPTSSSELTGAEAPASSPGLTDAGAPTPSSGPTSAGGPTSSMTGAVPSTFQSITAASIPAATPAANGASTPGPMAMGETQGILTKAIPHTYMRTIFTRE